MNSFLSGVATSLRDLPDPTWPLALFLLAFAIVATLCIEAGRRLVLQRRITELARCNAELKEEIHDAQATISTYVIRDEKWVAEVARLTEELAAASQECVELKAALDLAEKLARELLTQKMQLEEQLLQHKRPGRRRAGVACAVPSASEGKVNP